MKSKFLMSAALAFFTAVIGIPSGTVYPSGPATGADVLAKVEETLSMPLDMESTCEMILANKDGSGREKRILKMYSAGKEKRLIKFIEPAGIDGIGLLVEGEDEMYIYLPGMDKIRRIEGGSKDEDFQGTDFSYDELSSYEYQKDYSAEIESDEGQSYLLDLRRKQGSLKGYDTIKMTVDKSDNIPSRMELYNLGVLKKILTFEEVTNVSDYYIPVKIRMEDVARVHYTEMTLSGIKLDQNLDRRDIFTKRFLKKKEK